MSAKVEMKLMGLVVEQFKEAVPLITEMVKDGYSIHIPFFFGGEKKSRLMDVIRACNSSLLEAEIYDYLISRARSGYLSVEDFEDAVVQVEAFFDKMGAMNKLALGMHIAVLDRLRTVLDNEDLLENESPVLDGYAEILDFLMARMTKLEPGRANRALIDKAIFVFKARSVLLGIDMEELGW